MERVKENTMISLWEHGNILREAKGIYLLFGFLIGGSTIGSVSTLLLISNMSSEHDSLKIAKELAEQEKDKYTSMIKVSKDKND